MTCARLLAKGLMGFGLGLGLVLAAAGPGLARSVSLEDHVITTPRFAPGILVAQLTGDIEFGDDSSEWANDGECDDPRFSGEGTAEELVAIDIMKDATDCRAAYEAGTVVLAESGEMTEGEVLALPDDAAADEAAPEATEAETTETEATETADEPASDPAAEVDFGDDTSQWANDGECDDPRFTGTGMALELVDADIGKDATDCGALFATGAITLDESFVEGATAAIDFGDDSGGWPNDDECDDPRFSGTGVAASPSDENILRDATDCRVLYEAGSIQLIADGEKTDLAAIDFGDDSSQWANDSECDDPRFEGSAMATSPVEADLLSDATDCRAAYEAGTVTLITDGLGDSGAAVVGDIDFGDDSGGWPNDDECDDPRFIGEGMATSPSDDNILKDATDCRVLFEAGSISLAADSQRTVIEDIDFGTDTSQWAEDGECDDPRFAGSAMAASPVEADTLADATDCREAYAAGTISLLAEAGANAAFDFGFDSSRWANDGECDDPRFTGQGTDKKLLPEDELGDATDCQTLLDAGEVSILDVYQPTYLAGAPYDGAGIEFGNNTSTYANDSQCDDPRFQGPGAAMTRLESDEFRDANDCRTAFEAGTVMLLAQ